MSRTIEDWLTHARAASDPDEVDRCLAAAEELAVACHDWRSLLAGIAGIASARRERLAHAADRALALALEEREIWGFRDAAAIRAGRLDDEAGARAALEACFTLFRAPRTDLLAQAAEMIGEEERTRGYEWVLLAQGFSNTLKDDAGMRRCLDAGLAMARAHDDADDLCAIADAWAERVDREAGIALLREAEALADNGSARPWTLANAWHALGDASAVERVLGAALAKAGCADDALHVLSAWASHGEPPRARTALARAEELATTAADWLAIGEAAYDANLGEEAIRRAVARAEPLAEDDETRARTASAYKIWLGDDDAAARVGPRGVRPEALRARARSLEGWEISASALFDELRARAGPDVLAKIAHADYGMDEEKHLAALRDICETGLVPRRLAWEPHEVLALTRWSRGEGVDHVERALACVLLCLSPGELDELVTNGPILAESCLALGAETSLRAEAFFAWRAETARGAIDDADPDDADPEEAIALLLLFLLRAASAPEDPRLEPLAARLVAHPSFAHQAIADQLAASMRADLWRELAERILVPVRDGHPPVANVLRALCT